MTVYVDDMNRAGRVGRISSRWSHLYADTHAELEDFARQLGLRRPVDQLPVRRPGSCSRAGDVHSSSRSSPTLFE